jgi:epsilon-lactone hydrolase
MNHIRKSLTLALMTKTILQGRLSHRVRSLTRLICTIADVIARRVVGRPLVPQWTTTFEIGTLFFRHQFNDALALPNIAESREYFDSLYTVVEAHPQVDVRTNLPGEPCGDWFIPRGHKSSLTLLYFHGGGYAFYGAVSRHFIAMLAQMLQVPIFAPDYRLTPEHPHPAQLDDGLAAYRHLLETGIAPSQLIVGGDSAGGHLALMLIAKLCGARLPQPALVIALSPWTDIGKRGDSQFGNDRYDMVQGYQTLLYGMWLRAGTIYTDEELSPIHQSYQNVAPIYLQAGGKEILVDMIRDFARILEAQGASVRLDVWEYMTHEFHAYGSTLPQSQQAIDRLRAAIAWATGDSGGRIFLPVAQTEVDSLTLPIGAQPSAA